jgi:hypothetical protein
MHNPTTTLPDLERLIRLGDVLIPANETFPRFSNVEDIASFLRKSISACGRPAQVVEQALLAISDISDLESARQFRVEHPDHFAIASTIVAGAYYMSPDVLRLLNYPLEHQHPAGMEEFAEEYETGIVDPVIERGSRYVDPGNSTSR